MGWRLKVGGWGVIGRKGQAPLGTGWRRGQGAALAVAAAEILGAEIHFVIGGGSSHQEKSGRGVGVDRSGTLLKATMVQAKITSCGNSIRAAHRRSRRYAAVLLGECLW